MFKYSTLLLVFLFIACEERKVLRQEAGSAESVSAKGKAATESKSGRVRSSERPETNTLLSLKEEIEVMVPADFDRLWTAVGELDASPAQKQFLLENC
ncbi:MAG: hypothetical protein MUF13_13135, partial [Akkermansiaceae bacterium]|nr:hypothetical protein [Akkermansiaceae bacterium]